MGDFLGTERNIFGKCYIFTHACSVSVVCSSLSVVLHPVSSFRFFSHHATKLWIYYKFLFWKRKKKLANSSHLKRNETKHQPARATHNKFDKSINFMLFIHQLGYRWHMRQRRMPTTRTQVSDVCSNSQHLISGKDIYIFRCVFSCFIPDKPKNSFYLSRAFYVLHSEAWR